MKVSPETARSARKNTVACATSRFGRHLAEMELRQHAGAHLGGFAGDLGGRQPRHVIGRHAQQPVGIGLACPAGADQIAAQPQPLDQLGRQHRGEQEAIPAAAFIAFARAGQRQFAQFGGHGAVMAQLHRIVAGEARQDALDLFAAAHRLDRGGMNRVEPLVFEDQPPAAFEQPGLAAQAGQTITIDRPRRDGVDLDFRPQMPRHAIRPWRAARISTRHNRCGSDS